MTTTGNSIDQLTCDLNLADNVVVVVNIALRHFSAQQVF